MVKPTYICEKSRECCINNIDCGVVAVYENGKLVTRCQKCN